MYNKIISSVSSDCFDKLAINVFGLPSLQHIKQDLQIENSDIVLDKMRYRLDSRQRRFYLEIAVAHIETPQQIQKIYESINIVLQDYDVLYWEDMVIHNKEKNTAEYQLYAYDDRPRVINLAVWYKFCLTNSKPLRTVALRPALLAPPIEPPLKTLKIFFDQYVLEPEELQDNPDL